MKLLLAVLLSITGFALQKLSAQDYFSIKGAANKAMGGAGVANVDLWSANNNQAAMAFYKPSFAAGFYYANAFMIKETSLTAGALVYPTKTGTFGFTVNSCGYPGFNTKKIGIGFGKKLSGNFSAGLQLDYINIYIGDNYGSRGFFTFEAGVFAQATDKISVAAHVFNPVRVKIADYNDERLPVVMNVGLTWQASPNLTLAAEAESDITNKLIVKTGVEYKIADVVYARLGISDNPNIFSFGAGVHLGNFRIDFSSSMHQVLGYSPQFSLTYEFD